MSSYYNNRISVLEAEIERLKEENEAYRLTIEAFENIDRTLKVIGETGKDALADLDMGSDPRLNLKAMAKAGIKGAMAGTAFRKSIDVKKASADFEARANNVDKLLDGMGA